MNLNEETAKEFDEAIKPVIRFLNKHYHPHMRVVVDNVGARIVEDMYCTGNIDFED